MRITLIILLFGMYLPVSGQFNIAVGYSLGYTPADEINKLVGDFNDKNFNDTTNLGNPMEELHFLHGLNVGLRWKYEKIAFEVNWENLNRSREALGEDAMDVQFKQTVYYSINNYSASLETSVGAFGFGLGAGVRDFKVKEEIAVSGEKRAYLNESQYFIKPFISLNVIGGEKVGLSIKPYISFPLNSILLNPLADDLGLIQENRQERLFMAGVSFVFYNGNQ